jgi:predicted transcriptional regulator
MAPPSSERNEKGRFEAEHEVTKDDVFEKMEPLEPYTTGELAEKADAPRRTIYHYLEELYEEGRIQKKKPEPRRAIWMRGN